MLSEDKKKELIADIKTRIPNLSCPMCQNRNFIITDGYFNNIMQDGFQNLNIGGSGIPTIGIVCTNCGFLSQHALGALGKLQNETNKKG